MEFEKGHILFGQYEILDVKRGGMGVVYIAHHREWDRMFAIKSFQDRFFKREKVVKDFYREADAWTKLERNENIVTAYFVLETDYKPHIFLEYVDGGNLRDWIMGRRLDLRRSIDFAIQFCDGMIYANSVDLGEGKKGIVHRDIKPENIMLTKEGLLKITDFGLVKALDEVVEGFAGTKEYSSPEQFLAYTPHAERILIDSRSDIYSFGVVLYEMLTGERTFKGLGFEDYAHQHMYQRPKPLRQINPSIPVELEQIVFKCLEKTPEARYQTFDELRKEIMRIYQSLYGKRIEVKKRIQALTAMEYVIKGYSLARLRSFKDAICCFNRALELDPTPHAWKGKGTCLNELGKFEEAIQCYNQALRIDPENAEVWNNKGVPLVRLGRLDDGLRCFDRALEIDPTYVTAWKGKGASLNETGRFQEGMQCLKRALELNPRDATAWNEKAFCLFKLNRHEEADRCLDRALEINPRHVLALFNKGWFCYRLRRYDDAAHYFGRAAEVDPEYVDAWHNRGDCLAKIGKHEDAIYCFDRVLKLDPALADAWRRRGDSLAYLGRLEEAARSFSKARKYESKSMKEGRVGFVISG